MAVSFDSNVTKLIQDRQKELIFNSLEMGEIVKFYEDARSFLGVVILKRYLDKKPVIGLLFLSGESYEMRTTFDVDKICSLFIGSEEARNNVEAFKIRLEWANTYFNKVVDNLTYIEILARLREYELTIK